MALSGSPPLAFDYELTDETGAWLWRMHWHPAGRSHVGARIRRDDWEDVLYASVTAHARYRTWSTTEPLAVGTGTVRRTVFLA